MSLLVEKIAAKSVLKPVENGTFIAIVGASGAGKDTLMNFARDALKDREDVFFVQRVITRPTDGATEDHIPATDAGFEDLAQDGHFAFAWQAHGLMYGLPAEIDALIADGKTAVCNGSRAALAGLKQRYANFVVINITARRDVLASRLAARGREDRDQILQRLDRGRELDAQLSDAIVIDNSGAVETAGRALVEAIVSAGKSAR